MHHPYQCVAVCQQWSAGTWRGFMLAACGSQIVVVNSRTSDILSTWAGNDKQDSQADKDSSPEITIDDEPAKKKRKPNPAQSAPPITKIIATKDGNHVIVTTGEDKAVLVLALDDAGNLTLLSRRRMPKRPCAITLTPDNATILVGDKFGDVYGLPLIAPASDSDIAKAPQEEPKPAPRPFKPSATDLTVHTVRNRKALDAQIKQSVTNTAPKQTEELNFAHELLLGHVAMLTNIICISVTDSFGMGKQTDRTYIITADRDEHIRVSRGPPQAHIIDSYCFGHTSFVSSLCIVPQSYNRILVSGGGDDFLLVWDLLTSRIIARIDLRAAMKKFWATLPIRRRKSKKQLAQAANDDAMLLHDSREAMGKEEQSTNPEELVDEQVDDEVNEKIAVVGLWAEPMPSDGKPPLLPHGAELYCALEGIPAILQFQIPMNASDLGRDGKMLTRIHATILPLSGNPLDAVFTGNGDQMFVCVDNIHEPGSTTEVRRKPGIRMEVVETIGETHFDPKEKLLEKLTTVEVAEDEKELKALRDLLYSTENLRKRGGEEP